MRRFRHAFVLVLAPALVVSVLHDRALAQGSEHTWSGITGPEDVTFDGSDPYPGHSWIWREAISGDGRFVTFWSSKTKLGPDDTNGVDDAFVRDRVTQQTEIVSIASDGSLANNASSHPTISADGRHVAFRSCASNLVLDDTNGRCDVFVRDRQFGTTSRVNVGPSGEQAKDDESFFFSQSRDGRYVAFIASFTTPDTDRHVWLRDRDSDADGVFDEPDATSTTRISTPTVGEAWLGNADAVTISGNARFIAYTARATQGDLSGGMLFAHDRETGTTMRIDVPTAGLPDVPGYSYWPDLDDEGRHLVYSSDAPNLVENDGDTVFDLFVFNLMTGGNTRLRFWQWGTPALDGWWTPSISGDGRYVAFMGSSDIGGTFAYKSFVIDRQIGWYEISANADGTPDTNGNGGIPSISADGSSVAFGGSSSVVNDPAPSGQIFVAIDLMVLPTFTDIPAIGGVLVMDVFAPANTPWTVRGFSPQVLDAYGPTTGVGTGTVIASVLPNDTGAERDLILYVGSERVLIHQGSVPVVTGVMPPFGPISGGTVVHVTGQGFAQGAIVMIGGGLATNVTVVDSTTIEATTASQTSAGPADVLVVNPDGSVGWLQGAFFYEDSTPPVIEPVLSGTLGNDGWYISDVLLTWNVSDPQSEIWQNDCVPATYNWDSRHHVGSCSAHSAGGSANGFVEFKRDATPPTIAIAGPLSGTVYARGEQVGAAFVCEEPSEGSGIAQCSGPLPAGSAVDTSNAGSFTFTVTARDVAGNQSTATASYTVSKSVPALVWLTPAPVTYGTALGAAQLNASTNVPGTYTYTPALGTIVPAGTHTLTVTFVPNDSANYENATASVSLTVQKATPAISWPGSTLSYGTPLGDAQLNASTGVAGTFAYSPAAGALLTPGTHTLSVMFTPADAANYNSANAAASLTVTPAALTVRADDTSKVYGQALPLFTATATGFVAGETMASLAGSLSFATAATPASAPGTYSVSPSGVSSSNYTISFVPGTLTVAKASTSTTLSTTPNPSGNQKPVQMSASVIAVAPGAGTPSGTVQFSDNGTVIGTASLVNGVATFTVNLRKGTHPLTAVYAGNGNFTGSLGSKAHLVK